MRTFFPVHEFDNAFGGTKMIAGDQGEIINAGNRLETGSFWSLEPCPADQQDAEQYSVAPANGPATQLLNGSLSSMLGGSPLPVYGPPPQCNTRGLTSLGAYLIAQMANQRLIIQTDHMDSKTASRRGVDRGEPSLRGRGVRPLLLLAAAVPSDLRARRVRQPADAANGCPGWDDEDRQGGAGAAVSLRLRLGVG